MVALRISWRVASLRGRPSGAFLVFEGRVAFIYFPKTVTRINLYPKIQWNFFSERSAFITINFLRVKYLAYRLIVYVSAAMVIREILGAPINKS